LLYVAKTLSNSHSGMKRRDLFFVGMEKPGPSPEMLSMAMILSAYLPIF